MKGLNTNPIPSFNKNSFPATVPEGKHEWSKGKLEMATKDQLHEHEKTKKRKLPDLLCIRHIIQHLNHLLK